MRRFLLIALGASLLIPNPAKAESVWLLVTKTRSIEKIQMRNMEQCLAQGELWEKNAWSSNAHFVCLTGK